MSFDDYEQFDGLGLAALVANGDVSPTDLVEAAITRIEKLDPVLNAVVHRAYESARRDATSTLPDGPFRGVPFLIKDLGCPVAGMPQTSGSRYLRNEVPSEDGIMTRRYREAGMIILGKTNTPEFGITGTTESAQLGPCRNPWNPEHISGGSSGGSAAATASGMVPMAHASDGLGSIRIPAACCGLVGLKTTRDRNPSGMNDPDRILGFVVDHIVSRTVRDSAAMLDWTGRSEPGCPYAAPFKERPYLEEMKRDAGRLRIAFSTVTPGGRAIDPEIETALHETAKHLEVNGHDVFEAKIHVDWRALYAAQSVMSSANAAANLTRTIERIGREPNDNELERLTWAGIRHGRKQDGEGVMRAWGMMRVLTRKIIAAYEDFDVFLTPVMGTPPPKIGHIDPVGLAPRELGKRQAVAFPFTPPCNFTGQPAISLPLAWSEIGLPIGMQFAARYADEATLFRLAAQLEQTRPWADRRPGVWA
ncbi:MAG: amidase [Myxococcota bacterium]